MVIKNSIIAAIVLVFISVSAISGDDNHQLEQIDINQYLTQTEQLRTNNHSEFAYNLNELEKIKNNFSKQQSCFYNYLKSYQFSLQGNYIETITELEKLILECDRTQAKIKIHTLLATLLGISHRYKEALYNLDVVINEVDDKTNNDIKNNIYSAAAIVYHLINQNELSIRFSDLLVDQSPSEINSCKAKVLNYSAKLQSNIKHNFQNEIPKIIKECSDLGELIYAQDLNVNWLKYRYKNHKAEDEVYQILDELNQSDETIDNLNYKNLIGLKNSLFAQINARLGNWEGAKNYANLAILDSKTLGTTEQKIEALQVLIDYYQDLQDYKTANRYLIEKNQDEKRMYSDEQAKLMAYQTVKHDNLAKTHQIKSLNHKNEVLLLKQKIDEKEKKEQKYLNFIFLIILMFFVYFIYRSRKQHQKFKRLSELDHMTLIYNRKGIRDFMAYLLPYSEKKSETIAYGIFDLDLFKKINDQYGHITGDWVIKKVIKVCQELNNDKVTFARLGGEEFAIIMRDASIDEIKEFSEKCRQAIENIVSLDELEFDINITASFGITTTEISGYDYTKLMIHADYALYDSKHAGRNKISVYSASQQ